MTLELSTSVTSGDLAIIALRNGYAKKIELTSYGSYIGIYGYVDCCGERHTATGFWSVRARRFKVELSLVEEGLWRLSDDTYVAVGRTIEVVVGGKSLVSKPNICADDSEFAEYPDRRINVHVIGSVPWFGGVKFTAFRCWDWRDPINNDFYASKFAFDKTNRRTYVDETPIETRDIFIKRGRVVKVLVNPTCEEYVRTVERLFGVKTSCIDRR